MPHLLPLLRTINALGLKSVARVALYRLALRLRIHRVLYLREENAFSPFFSTCQAAPNDLVPSSKWATSTHYFGWAEFPITSPAPDWHFNPFSGRRVNAEQHWSKLPDFSDAGDVKIVWEPSRFDWVISNAQRTRSGDVQSHERIERWLNDWTENNPAYRGPNWKCGQEASIRVMHLAIAAIILGQERGTSPALLKLIKIHLRRIAPTMSYAIGQNNNHGTSEAAALFIGGSWLQHHGHNDGAKWAKLGRKVLEDRVKVLVARDGSFSQYSTVYQRVLIDTLIIVDRWRDTFGLKNFSAIFYERAASATLWLHNFTDADTGDAPNIGANDGASFLPLSDNDFRDFRPTIQMAAALFCNARAYPQLAKVDEAALWLGISIPKAILPPRKSTIYYDSGFAILNRDAVWGYLHFPRFKFRPSQADLMHFDLWRDGECLLGDGGSYSYAADHKTYSYFAGTKSHNTVMFDRRDQMARIGRFLYADWLEVDSKPCIDIDQHDQVTIAAYKSRDGICHERTIRLGTSAAIVIDEVSGFQNSAVLRWRLPKGQWSLEGHIIRCANFTLKFNASVPIERAQIVTGSRSLYYLNKEDCLVLEIEVSKPGTLTTHIEY